MCLWNVVCCLFEPKPQPPVADSEELIDTALLHYRALWQLREHFRLESMPLYQITAKAHSNVHTCFTSASMNPRLVWCFQAEDFIAVCTSYHIIETHIWVCPQCVTQFAIFIVSYILYAILAWQHRLQYLLCPSAFLQLDIDIISFRVQTYKRTGWEKFALWHQHHLAELLG